jgi:hypothetical protein
MAEPQSDSVVPPPIRRRADFRRRAQELLLLEVAIADPVLGCHNRAYLVHRARDEIARRQRYGQRLSLLLVEADRPIRGPEEVPSRRSRRSRASPSARPIWSLAGTPASSSCSCLAPGLRVPRAWPAACVQLSRRRICRRRAAT